MKDQDRSKEIEAEAGHIESELSRLQDAIADLEASLSGFLPKLDKACIESTSSEDRIKESSEEPCPMANRIRTYRKSIEDCISLIVDYNSRIQL